MDLWRAADRDQGDGIEVTDTDRSRVVVEATRSGYALAPSDGTPIYYTARGGERPAADPRRPTLALCDGIGCDGFVWKYLRRDLAGAWPMVHWHYRGHGRTPAPRDPARVTIADLADDLACVLDEIGRDRAVVLGHSMGVQVALETYRRHPERVAALVLLCGAPGTPLRTFGHTRGLERLLPALRATVRRAPWAFNQVSRAILPTRIATLLATRLEVNGALIDEQDLQPYFRGISRVDVGLFLDMLEAANRHSATDILGHIDVPTLIVAGERDGFTPAALSRQMHEAIPGSELLLIDHASHTAPLERPGLVGRTISEFLARRVAPPG